MILDFYDDILKFLKFCLKNNESDQFKSYSLVENFSLVLEDFNKSIEAKGFNFERLDYQELLKIIFSDEKEESLPYFTNDKKVALVRNFEVLIHIYNFLSDRMGQYEVNKINKEIRALRREVKSLMKYFDLIIE